jgi:hypothetical protein
MKAQIDSLAVAALVIALATGGFTMALVTGNFATALAADRIEVTQRNACNLRLDVELSPAVALSTMPERVEVAAPTIYTCPMHSQVRRAGLTVLLLPAIDHPGNGARAGARFRSHEDQPDITSYFSSLADVSACAFPVKASGAS